MVVADVDSDMLDTLGGLNEVLVENEFGSQPANLTLAAV